MKRIMQLIVVMLAVGAIAQTVANAVEKQGSSKERQCREGAEPGI
jgi:hypothetical protein